jgi:carbon-monoxide dehydrogenase large subunit
MREGLVGKFVGARVRRVEDRRLLTGKGRYIDDVTVPGMAHAAFLRSSFPHAYIRSIDTTEAARLPGVYGVLTGADMQRLTNPFLGMLALEGLYEPTFYALATDRVRHVGDPVAIVVAESRHVAEDACELIDVDYEPIDAVATMEQAHDPSRPMIWPKARGNVLYRDSRTHGDVDAAFAAADRVITERFRQHRQSNQPMEARGSLAEIDPVTGELTFHSATQSTHTLKWSLGLLVGRARMRDSIKKLATNRERPKRFVKGARAYLKSKPGLLGVFKQMAPVMVKQNMRDPKRVVHLTQAALGLLAKEPHQLPRVVAGDIGGAFGAKTVVAREDVALCAAALELGRSVKWIEDRSEHLTVGGQAREEDVELSVAVKNDGTLLGMRAKLTMDAGAYPGFPYGATFFAGIVRVMIPGPYRWQALQFDLEVTASNKGTYVAYRGPWAVETWVRERMLDIIARQLDLSPAEIRRRNLIGPEELPTKMITGPDLDVRMSAKRTLEEALEAAGADGWEALREQARTEGRVMGIGLATFIEAAPGPPGYFDHIVPGFASMVGAEPAHTVLETDGSVSIITSQVPHGQGHETTLAQVAADELGLPVESVRLRYGDSSVAPFSLLGTGGSRSAAMAGGVVTLGARELRGRVIDLAADLLEAAPDDLVIEDGRVHVAGSPTIDVSFADVAAEAIKRGSSAPEGEAIRVTTEWDGGEGGWTQATHVCFVDVDLETGRVAIPRYVVVEDCGELINPAIVDGQIRGGIAQGVGAVLYEKATYDETGQFQASTFMDYLIPTVMEIPEIEIHHIQTPSSIEANYRGVGEGGMILAPAAITNAIEDALAHLGVRITEQYLPPGRILELAGVVASTPAAREPATTGA